MPISISSPSTIILDKIRIEEFSIKPQDNKITIHYSKGYIDNNNIYIPKEYDRADLSNIIFNPDTYEIVKNELYVLLENYINNPIDRI